MSVLVVKAKVIHHAEEEFDMLMWDEEVAEKPLLVWRMIAIPIENIFQIIQYDKEKSIILTTGMWEFMVKEPFMSLQGRWDEARQASGIKTNYPNRGGETISGDL